MFATAAAALFFTAGNFEKFWSEFGGYSFNDSLVSSLQVFLVFAVTMGLIRFFGRWRYGGVAAAVILSLIPLVVLMQFYVRGYHHVAVNRYSIFLTTNILVTTVAILIWDNATKERVKQTGQAT